MLSYLFIIHTLSQAQAAYKVVIALKLSSNWVTFDIDGLRIESTHSALNKTYIIPLEKMLGLYVSKILPGRDARTLGL